MRLSRWGFVLALTLALVSAAFYLVQIQVFHRPHDTFFYMLQDLAFVPIQVLLVTLILNDLMVRREKRNLLNKMNMVIGAFFGEMGTGLIRQLAQYDTKAEELENTLRIDPSWDDRRFRAVRRELASGNYEIDARREEA